MSTKYKVKDYISNEHQQQFTDFCLRDSNILMIKGGTGIGKTYAIIMFALANPDKKIVVALPKRSLVENLKNDEAYIKLGISHLFGYGRYFINNNQDSNLIFTTYDSALMIDGIDIIFIDEAHEIAGSAGYREAVIKIIGLNCKKILSTATPLIIQDLPELACSTDSFIEFVDDRADEVVTILTTRKLAKSLAREIIDSNTKKDRTLLIRINHKDVIDTLLEYYTHKLPNLMIGAIYSDDKRLLSMQSKETTESLKKGDLRGFDIVFCTSILDAGLSFKVDRNVFAYALTHSNKVMPNPILMRQFHRRVRTNSGFNLFLTIAGSFGNGYNDLDEGLSGSDMRIICQTMNDKFEGLQHLLEDDYLNILADGKLVGNIISEWHFVANPIYSSSRATLTDIICNYKSVNPKGYNTVYSQLESNGTTEQARHINGDKKITGESSNANIKKADRILDDLTTNKIPLGIMFNQTIVGSDIQIKFTPNKIKTIKAVKENKNDSFIGLVKGMVYNTDSTFNFKELGYDLLLKDQQKTIRTLFEMMYNRANFNGNKAKKVFKQGITADSEIVKYLNLLTNK